jgi:cold shock CspA family protein
VHPTKRVGFIWHQKGKPDLFFHANDLAEGLEFSEQLKEQRVRFTIVDTPRGPRAANVQAAE